MKDLKAIYTIDFSECDEGMYEAVKAEFLDSAENTKKAETEKWEISSWSYDDEKQIIKFEL